jgi:MoaA/NifB/PqqE/SkfB family radical SAM enzyme
MNRLSALIYHTVHTHGLAANAVYAAAYHVRELGARWDRWRAKASPVRMDQVRECRHILAAAGMTLGVTSICNAKCVFCAYPRAVASKGLQAGVMPFELFKKAVDEWASLEGQSIDLTHTVGDPLVDPGLLEKIEYARKQARIPLTTLTTNGILLDRNETYKGLVDLGVSAVAISTQGTDPEIYRQVYGVDQYEEVISGVHHLLDYNRSQGEPVAIAIRFRNAQKPSEIIRSEDFQKRIKPYLSGKVRCNFTVDYDNWGGTITEQDMAGVMRLRKAPPKLDIPCVSLFGFLIRHDGSVRLCGCRFKRTDMDDLVVGNIRRQSLLEISTGDRAWGVISGFAAGVRPESCEGCRLYRPVDKAWHHERIARLASLPMAPGAPSAEKPAVPEQVPA